MMVGDVFIAAGVGDGDGYGQLFVRHASRNIVGRITNAPNPLPANRAQARDPDASAPYAPVPGRRPLPGVLADVPRSGCRRRTSAPGRGRTGGEVAPAAGRPGPAACRAASHGSVGGWPAGLDHGRRAGRRNPAPATVRPVPAEAAVAGCAAWQPAAPCVCRTDSRCVFRAVAPRATGAGVVAPSAASRVRWSVRSG